ncbi:Serine proteases trypsin domain [Trinorchestia longiramus]|nr:Serine proteases trypsin domain [Trinorchestia longiramus]
MPVSKECSTPFLWQCKNLRCVHASARCNGKDDCGDNSDEEGCPRTSQYKLRLVGGSGDHEGNVQLLVKEEWGHVCDDSFGWKEADRICRDLGYSNAASFTKNNFFARSRREAARGGVRFWLDGVTCGGDEESFFQCHSRAIGRHNCGPTEVAGVICRTETTSACGDDQFQCGVRPAFSCIARDKVCDGTSHCFDGSDERRELCQDVGVVRLEASAAAVTARGSQALGTVFVKHEGRWGTVCDDGFDASHAKVVCRSLGYEGGWAIPYSRATLGRGRGSVLVDEPLCRGSESSLDECRGINWGVTDCDHSEDAGVFCSDPEVLRLVGGSGPHQGRVEVKLSGVWGTICDDDFDDYDASVVCRSLGYTHGGIAHKRARFGAGAGVIWLDVLDCTGTEASLRECIKSAPGTGTCSHMEDAGVTCYTDRRAHSADLQAVSSRLSSACGRASPAGRLVSENLAKIVGGRTISPRETPWSVSLMIREGNKLRHNCGGVIVSEDLILTAAHCFRKHPKQNYVVRVGEHDLLANDDGQKDYLVDKLWVHDEFDTNIEFNNDIAVLKIMRVNGRGLQLGNGAVEAVCLPSKDERLSELQDCSITGWGTLTENAPAVPQRLPRVGAVEIYDMATCTSSNGYGKFEVTSGMTCAGRLDGRVDTCTGDSGGPLTCIKNGRHVLYGITSWGKGCGQRGKPGMYTKVTKYLRWLNQFVS